MVYFTSDLHLGHKAIIKYRDEKFKTRDEHDRYILDKILSLTKRDILFIVGDFLFDCDEYDWYINELMGAKCRIKLIMGNHDSLKLYKEDIFEVQLPLFSYKNMWIGHCPIHPQEMRNRVGNIHGHLHLEKVQTKTKVGEYLGVPIFDMSEDSRYFNVNLDVNNYEFVKLETIKEYFGLQSI